MRRTPSFGDETGLGETTPGRTARTGETERRRGSRSAPDDLWIVRCTFVTLVWRRDSARRAESRAWRTPLRERVLGAAAALRGREAAAFGRDGAALDAVRGGELDLDGAVAVGVSDLVDLRGAQVDPHLRELARDPRLDADVVRLVVARSVARREHARELVERQRPVGRRVRGRAIRRRDRLVGVALRLLVSARELPLRRRHRARERAADVEAAAERLAHVAHLLQ